MSVVETPRQPSSTPLATLTSLPTTPDALGSSAEAVSLAVWEEGTAAAIRAAAAAAVALQQDPDIQHQHQLQQQHQLIEQQLHHQLQQQQQQQQQELAPISQQQQSQYPPEFVVQNHQFDASQLPRNGKGTIFASAYRKLFTYLTNLA